MHIYIYIFIHVLHTYIYIHMVALGTTVAVENVWFSSEKVRFSSVATIK